MLNKSSFETHKKYSCIFVKFSLPTSNIWQVFTRKILYLKDKP